MDFSVWTFPQLSLLKRKKLANDINLELRVRLELGTSKFLKYYFYVVITRVFNRNVQECPTVYISFRAAIRDSSDSATCPCFHLAKKETFQNVLYFISFH